SKGCVFPTFRSPSTTRTVPGLLRYGNPLVRARLVSSVSRRTIALAFDAQRPTLPNLDRASPCDIQHSAVYWSSEVDDATKCRGEDEYQLAHERGGEAPIRDDGCETRCQSICGV